VLLTTKSMYLVVQNKLWQVLLHIALKSSVHIKDPPSSEAKHM